MSFIKDLLAFLLTCLNLLHPVHGIDVSHRQGDIDWVQVTQDDKNIQFAFVKASEGTTFLDPKFKDNVIGANNVGIEVGAYHFFRMSSSPETQFKTFKSQIESCKEYLTLKPLLDVETFDKSNSKQLKDAVDKFVKLCYEEFGVYPIIYGPDIAPERMLSEWVNENCLFFLGQPQTFEPKQKHALWQYSAWGHVDGINTDVDLDLLHYSISLKDLRLEWNFWK